METVDCVGYMVPGVSFSSGHTIWLFHWNENPTDSVPLTELWVFYPDGKRVCYLDPVKESDFFSTYHDFAEVIGAEIRVKESKTGVYVDVEAPDRIRLELVKGFSPLYAFLNRLLPGKKGLESQTETGKMVYNFPRRLVKVARAEAQLNGSSLGSLTKPLQKIMVGTAQCPKQPFINYCTHRLER